MRAETLACCTFLLFLAALCPCALHAQGDAKTEAKRRYEQALTLYEEGAYDAALVELKRAHQLRPSSTLVYNIALVHLALHDFASALVAFRRYLSDAGSDISGQRKADVQARLEELSGRVAKVTVQVDVDGAEILIDYKLATKSPRRTPLLVNAGTRLVSVRHPDYPPQHRRITVAGGDAVTLKMSLRSGAPAVVMADEAKGEEGSVEIAIQPQALRGLSDNPTAPANPADEDRGRRTRLWVGWGVTAGLAVGTGIFALLASSANDRLARKRKETRWDPQALQEDATETQAFALTTDGLLLATLAVGGLSLWWTLDDGNRPQRPATGQNRGTWQLRLGPLGAHVRVSYAGP